MAKETWLDFKLKIEGFFVWLQPNLDGTFPHHLQAILQNLMVFFLQVALQQHG